MVQDLSKAYNRVNIDILRLALRRICIPEHFISFIINLFTNRTNRVLFDDWLGDPYDVLTGIDQGNSICPLLWVIYYDPLFQRINESSHPGVNYTIRIPTALPLNANTSYHSLTLDHKLLSYLDDTTWLTDNIVNLEANLSITDDFYSLTNIKINKKESLILSNNKSFCQQQSIPITFGTEIVKIDILPWGKSTRILGVHISANDSHKGSIKKMQQILVSFYGKRKSLMIT